MLVPDGDTPSLSSTASIIFRVLDEDDHSPKITFPVPDIQILENQLPSTITTFLAVDVDIANNGIVQYQIIGKVNTFIMYIYFKKTRFEI